MAMVLGTMAANRVLNTIDGEPMIVPALSIDARSAPDDYFKASCVESTLREVLQSGNGDLSSHSAGHARRCA